MTDPSKQEEPNQTLPDPPSNFTVEGSLSKELLKLSFTDRTEIEEEIHGVRCRAAEETPELIKRSLSGFDNKLNEKKEGDPGSNVLKNVVRIEATEGVNREPTGDQSSKCYLNDPDVRLRFLRCERFVVEKAVQRMIDFLEFMSELFGDYVCERPVRISDFSREEEAALQNSRNQYLPFRDRSGRRVLAGVGTCNFHLDMELRFKILMFLHWSVSEDVETQQKGVVMLCWAFDEANDSTWEKEFRPIMPKKLHEFHRKQNRALPVRIASNQQYYRDTAFFRTLSALYVFGLNSYHRSIYKVNFGEQTELLYRAASYGIPVDLMPISCTGTLKFANHIAFINVLKFKLDPKNGEEIVECPRAYDVVFRKGVTSRHNPGNLHYRELIESFSVEHFKGNKNEKFEITMRIINKVEERNGRFLEWLNKRQMWFVSTDRDKVRKKIAAAFKQFNRTRGDSLQIEKTILKTVASIEDIAPDTETATAANGRKASVINEFDFIQATKRRKVDMFTPFGTNKHEFIDIDFGGLSCFGKSFFPTEAAS
eukprot:CAMPEP_0201126250 /NCGR_PEP_ID=MMETSP0850-20130426/25300_1 /ASSEMBLY_ACC=CAM_ASM_000622 /TAXON_ID=183588 /ORGANISM="Pseudo-nitzschia fraudulenta, Strain WWA7" /LENGTH=538 /DNA_ID=CAMNT_0047394611 /DNA_START=30 /DNA_END=1646 /DNA_ORIENTATION=+